MSVSGDVIQRSLLSVGVGLAIGTVIELILPEPDASASGAKQAFEAAVQVALNGVAVSTVGMRMADGDPTYGFPFFEGLSASQPGLSTRLAGVAALGKSQATQAAQKMMPARAVADSPSQ